MHLWKVTPNIYHLPTAHTTKPTPRLGRILLTQLLAFPAVAFRSCSTTAGISSLSLGILAEQNMDSCTRAWSNIHIGSFYKEMAGKPMVKKCSSWCVFMHVYRRMVLNINSFYWPEYWFILATEINLRAYEHLCMFLHVRVQNMFISFSPNTALGPLNSALKILI